MKSDQCGYVLSRREKNTNLYQKGHKPMNNTFKANLIKTLANKKGNKGFTLIELLVVVIIIGVLAAIALPNLLGQVGKARESEAKTQIGALNRAQQGYFTEYSNFAADATQLEVPMGNEKYYQITVGGDETTGVGDGIIFAQGSETDAIKAAWDTVKGTAELAEILHLLLKIYAAISNEKNGDQGLLKGVSRTTDLTVPLLPLFVVPMTEMPNTGTVGAGLSNTGGGQTSWVAAGDGAAIGCEDTGAIAVEVK